jgi:hypothetical protein
MTGLWERKGQELKRLVKSVFRVEQRKLPETSWPITACKNFPGTPPLTSFFLAFKYKFSLIMLSHDSKISNCGEYPL